MYVYHLTFLPLVALGMEVDEAHMATVFHVTVLLAHVFRQAAFVCRTPFVVRAFMNFYSLVTLASYAVGMQPDVKMIVVEVVE